MSTATTIKERPILFNGPMVRAVVNGTKGQTRRMVKERPGLASVLDIVACGRCPYGEIGDRLWARETWAPRSNLTLAKIQRPFYRATDGVGDMKNPSRWRPSIHMPRWASRISLEITDVRVQRLNDINDEDAFAEGVDRCGHDGYHTDQGRCAFRSLWESINGVGSWDANPWVWAISFKRVQP